MENQLLITIMSGSIVAILSVSLTFFFTTWSNNKTISHKVKSSINTHREIDHQKKVEDEIDKHEDECLVRKDYFPIKTALVFLVKEAGGNPNEMGLT